MTSYTAILKDIDENEEEAKKLLTSIPNLKIHRIRSNTHAKVIAIDDAEMVVGSFNWLSHSYYKYTESSPEAKLFIKIENSVVTRDRETISRIMSPYYAEIE